jgi:hypothetical protein
LARAADPRGLDVDLVRHVLSTGIFAGQNQRFDFAHRSYAEYLAADALGRAEGMTADRAIDVLCDPEPPLRWVPQLRGTVSWATARIEGFASRAIERGLDAAALCHPDMPPPEKPAILTALLEDVGRQASHRDHALHRIGARWFGREDLGAVLGPYLDRVRPVVARRAAIELAARCGADSFREVIAEIALDAAEDPGLRAAAAECVARLGDPNGLLAALSTISGIEVPEATDRGFIAAIHASALRAGFDAGRLSERQVLDEYASAPYRTFAYDGVLICATTSGDLGELVAFLDAWPWSDPVAHGCGGEGLILKTIADRLWSEVPGGRHAEDLVRFVSTFPEEDVLAWEVSEDLSDTDRRWVLTRLVEHNVEEPLAYRRVVERNDASFVLDKLEQHELPTCWRVALAEVLRRFWNDQLPEDLRRRVVQADAQALLPRSTASPPALHLPGAPSGPKWEELATPSSLAGGHAETWLELCDAYGDNEEGRPLFDRLSEPERRENALALGSKYLAGYEASDKWFAKHLVVGKLPVGEDDYAEEIFLEAPPPRVRAALYALRFLLAHDRTREIDSKVWQECCEILVSAYGTGDFDRSLRERACQAAPKAFIASVRRRLELEGELGGSFAFLASLDASWNSGLVDAAVSYLEDKLPARVDADGCFRAWVWVLRSGGDAGRALKSVGSANPELRIGAAAVLLAGVRDWFHEVWSAIHSDDRVASRTLGLVARFVPSFFEHRRLDELLTLYRWIIERYPAEHADHAPGGWDLRAPGDMRGIRDEIRALLEERADATTAAELRALADSMPDHPHLQGLADAADAASRSRRWSGLQPSDVLAFCDDRARRFVRSGGELLAVTLDALRRVDGVLLRDLVWDSKDGEPKRKNETVISDYVRQLLEYELVEKGIVINREAEVARGSQTDILVQAVAPDGRNATIVIEVKCSDHNGVKDELETKLVDRYLAHSEHGHGIYLVCLTKDPREGLLDELASSAQRLGTERGKRIEVVAMDLPSDRDASSKPVNW